MKNILKFSLPLAALFLFTFQISAQTEAEEAIKKVCIAETQAWLDNDFEAWAATHSHDANETIAYTNPDGTFGSLVGWENIVSVIKPAAATGKKSESKLSNDNFKFIIRGEMAFAFYDQTIIDPDGKINKMHEYRALLLVNGEWKIAGVMAFWEMTEPKK